MFYFLFTVNKLENSQYHELPVGFNRCNDCGADGNGSCIRVRRQWVEGKHIITITHVLENCISAGMIERLSKMCIVLLFVERSSSSVLSNMS